MNNNARLSIIGTGVVLSSLVVALGLGTMSSNHLGWVLMIFGAGCCMTSLVCLVTTKYRDAILSQADDRSVWIIALAASAIVIAPPVEFLYLSAILPRAHLLQEAGLILFGSGIVLFLWSRSLLEWWDTGESPVKTDPPLTRAGAYQVIRYLAYLGLGLSAVGLCLGYSSLIGLVVVLAVLIPGMIYRMRYQNRRLAGDIMKD